MQVRMSRAFSTRTDTHAGCAGETEAAAPPLIFSAAPRRLRGRPSSLKGRCAIADATAYDRP
jgi:hypothetical protein